MPHECLVTHAWGHEPVSQCRIQILHRFINHTLPRRSTTGPCAINDRGIPIVVYLDRHVRQVDIDAAMHATRTERATAPAPTPTRSLTTPRRVLSARHIDAARGALSPPTIDNALVSAIARTDDATQRLVLDSARLAHPPLRTPYPPAQRSSCVTPRVARYISGFIALPFAPPAGHMFLGSYGLRLFPPALYSSVHMRCGCPYGPYVPSSASRLQ